MTFTRRSAAVAAVALVTGLAVPSFAGGSPAGGTGSIECGQGTVTWDPTTIWPPNHKMKTVNISFQSENANPAYDTSSVTVGAITHDQILTDGTEMNGSGNTLVDGDGTGNSDSAPLGEKASTTASVRNERSGQDATGRTYSIQVTCSDYNALAPGVSDPDSTETVVITVLVPHDQRRIK